MEFRKLNSDEIDVRIGTSKKNDIREIVGASYLLYKDARVDMALLDEEVGAMNWQRKHEFKDGKLYCSVGIYDEDKEQWIWKEDVGTESMSEAEKGQASDSFKRACFNWGIGRELYTAPFIWINALPKEDLARVRMSVREIQYNGNEISKLIIVDNNGSVRYKYDANTKVDNKVISRELEREMKSLNMTVSMIATYLGKNENEVTVEEIKKLIAKTKERKNARI